MYRKVISIDEEGKEIVMRVVYGIGIWREEKGVHALGKYYTTFAQAVNAVRIRLNQFKNS